MHNRKNLHYFFLAALVISVLTNIFCISKSITKKCSKFMFELVNAVSSIIGYLNIFSPVKELPEEQQEELSVSKPFIIGISAAASAWAVTSIFAFICGRNGECEE